MTCMILHCQTFSSNKQDHIILATTKLSRAFNQVPVKLNYNGSQRQQVYRGCQRINQHVRYTNPLFPLFQFDSKLITAFTEPKRSSSSSSDPDSATKKEASKTNSYQLDYFISDKTRTAVPFYTITTSDDDAIIQDAKKRAGRQLTAFHNVFNQADCLSVNLAGEISKTLVNKLDIKSRQASTLILLYL